MRVPVQIIGFSCFLFSVTFVQGQECLREDITYENIEPVAKASYDDDETVKLNCKTGYIGFYRLKCKNGQWLTYIARSCSKKKCGHPGETPNGEFKLIEGRDYTYGATVEYTCKTGYKMATRINLRHCRMKGWDNSIPVCEEVRCPVIHPDGDVTALGNTQEGTYGDVIHFECGSSDKKLDGSSVIHCLENGVWSRPVPQCIVICQLDMTKSGAEKTIPEGKEIFKAGETVQMICKNRDIYNYKTYTCTNNGKWDNGKPTCEEIKCEVPRKQHVYLPEYYFHGNLNLNVKKSYDCETGYYKMAAEATCTQDGWTPKPLCAEITCDPPKIPNAEIVGGQEKKYKISSRLEYTCHLGFKPEEPVQITCDSKGQWTDIQTCTDGTCQEQELRNVKILFGHPSITSPYKTGHILVFQCTDVNMRFYGQHAIECQSDGRWNYPYPQCGGTIECSQPTKNLQFVTLSDEKTVYSNFEILTYTCKEPYNTISKGVLMCQNGIWNGTFACKSGICPLPPYLQNGDYSIIKKTEKSVITEVSYTCQSYYVLDKQQDTYKCVDGKWETPPKCLKPCEVNDIVEKYNLKLPKEKVYIAHANKYRLDCTDGWNTGSEMRVYVDVSCSNGNLQIDKSCNTQNNRK